MSSTSSSLMEFAHKRFERALKHVGKDVGFLLKFSEFAKQLEGTLAKQAENFKRLEEKIAMEEFKKFLKLPQINDVWSDYICYLLIKTISGITPKKRILYDNILNYFVSVIENNFPDLSKEDSIISIKKYFNIITGVCQGELEDNLYSELALEKSEKFKASFIMDELTDKKLYSRYVQHIESVIKNDFVMKIPKYDSIKRDYIKSIKTYYQYGFIYLLGEYKFNEFYIPPILLQGGKREIYLKHIRQIEKIERITKDQNREAWKHIFDDQDIIYIVGGAGYGKSLFLKKIINDYSKLDIENSHDYLMIYCDLKSFYSNGNPGTKTMVDFFQECMISITGIDEISKEFIKYHLDMGRCIVLLDALDEVPKDVRDELHKKITSFFATCNYNNKVCITSRDRGFIPQKNIEVMEIIPLSAQDIEDYIQKMISLKKFKKEDKEPFMEQARVLIDKAFLNNFLVLSLLVNIYKAEKELPENKIDLYKKCFEYIAKKREEEKSKTGYNWQNIYPLMKDSTFISLSRLAAPNNKDIQKEEIEKLLVKQYKTKYADEATTECAIKEFLEFCSNRTELFVPSSVDDKFKFFHRSFFEYFYSRYIHQQPEVERMYELMSKFDVDSEVFELTIALVKEDNEEKYQDLVEYILKKSEEEFKVSGRNSTAFGILTLAMQVIDDAYYIQKYYELVIKYNKFMSDGRILCMNQKLICMWLAKIIEEDQNKRSQFIDTFSMHCIRYMLMMCAEIELKIINSKETHIIDIRNSHSLLDSENIPYLFESPFGIRNIPFYVLLYGRYSSLYELMERCIARGFGKVNIGEMKRSVLKRGFNNYKKLTREKKQQLLKLFPHKIQE